MLTKWPLWLKIALVFVALDLAILIFSSAAFKNLDFFQFVNLIPSLSLYVLFNDSNSVIIVVVGLAGFFLFGAMFGWILQKNRKKNLWLKIAILFGGYYFVSMWSLNSLCIMKNCGQGILVMFLTLPSFISRLSGRVPILSGTMGFAISGAIFYSIIGALVGLIIQIIQKSRSTPWS